MKTRIILFILICSTLSTFAQLKLPPIMGNSMVLQQKSEVRIWGKADADAKVVVTESWNGSKKQVIANNLGNWEVLLPTKEAGGAYTITIESKKEKILLEDIYLGEVWLCSGQSNMEMTNSGFVGQPVEGALETVVSANKYNHIRMFTGERQNTLEEAAQVEGSWIKASPNTVGDMSAIAYGFAKEIADVINVPIGIIQVSWGGASIQAWMGKESLEQFPEVNLKDLENTTLPPMRIPTALYNGMFLPVAKYTVKGMVWYQGESNVTTYKLYSKLFPEMVKDWRSKLGSNDLPFYYVQIAPFDYKDSEAIGSALFREVQEKALADIPYSGMAVSIDAGEETLIHPAKKNILSKRLAYMALANDYNYFNIPFQNPVYTKNIKKDGEITIFIDNAPKGLVQKKDSKISGFEIAGKDNVFMPADITIRGNRIIVSSKDVIDPQNVRYCFKNFSAGTIYNLYGLPLAPFRTDALTK